MKISKTHQKFANTLGYQDIIDHPENYLGPNWEAVINFWLYFDTLSKKQLKIVEDRYGSFLDKNSEAVEVSYLRRAVNAAEDTEGYTGYFVCVYYRCFLPGEYALKFTTYELIGIRKLLEQGHQPVFFPMFLNL
jgi:hypothetical protein